MRVRLFVYGTLQPNAGTRMSGWLERHLSSWQSASVPGRLFAVRAPQGWYPALLPDTGPAPCRGVVCHAKLGFGDLARLDRYEGAEYRRCVIRARTQAGVWMPAFAYLWRGATPASGARVVDGDFLSWMRRSSRAAYDLPVPRTRRH